MEVIQLLERIGATQTAFEKAKKLYLDRLAPDFSPFDFIEPDEMDLSRILAWLLTGQGATHGQGGRFLHLFVTRLYHDRPDWVWPLGACDAAEVRTEFSVAGGQGRMDVLVRSGGRTLVIENKAGARDQKDQLARYAAYLDDLGRPDARLIYLTPRGSDPEEGMNAEQKVRRTAEGMLHCWSYPEDILPWLAECRAVCRADRVSTFIDEFSRYIRKRFEGVADMTMQNHLVGEIVASPAMVEAAMRVILAGRDIRKSLVSGFQAQIVSETEGEGWMVSGKLSGDKESYISLDVSPICKYLFTFGFEKPAYKGFGYGVTFKDKNSPDCDQAQAALSSIARGNSNPAGGWAWELGTSPHDDLLPFAADWDLEAAPWVAIANGKLAKHVVQAAHRVRAALGDHGLL